MPCGGGLSEPHERALQGGEKRGGWGAGEEVSGRSVQAWDVIAEGTQVGQSSPPVSFSLIQAQKQKRLQVKRGGLSPPAGQWEVCARLCTTRWRWRRLERWLTSWRSSRSSTSELQRDSCCHKVAFQFCSLVNVQLLVGCDSFENLFTLTNKLMLHLCFMELLWHQICFLTPFFCPPPCSCAPF